MEKKKYQAMNLIQKLKDKLDQADLWEKTISLNRNEYLTVKGNTDTQLYYILSGSLRIYFEDEFEEQIIRLGYQNNFIAALDSFITDQASDLYIQIIKKCTLLVISKATFMNFLKKDPSNLFLWHQIMAQLIFQQMEREKDVLMFSPLKRYQRVLQRSPQLFQEIPNKYIASYLRMSPETLSRLKKSWFESIFLVKRLLTFVLASKWQKEIINKLFSAILE